jgi:hypothetical protein
MTIRCFNDFLADIYKQKKTDKTYLDSLNELKVSDWMSLADQYGEHCRNNHY